MDRNQFSRFEKRIQALIEGGFARLFAGRLHAREVALELVRAMEDNAQIDAEAQLAAPNRYVVRLHAADHAALLEAQPDLAEQLAQHLVDLAQESELHLGALPEVTLVAAEDVPPNTVRVTAQYVRSAAQATQAMTPISHVAGPDEAARYPTAFLVVDGDRYVPLQRDVINIGRRRDNAVVVDDPRVSRQHAQLRFRFGHFVLYDLGSRGGTTVNGAAVKECVLRANDVIGLAGVQVVYVVEESSSQTQPARGGDTQMRPVLPPTPPSLPEDE